MVMPIAIMSKQQIVLSNLHLVFGKLYYRRQYRSSFGRFLAWAQVTFSCRPPTDNLCRNKRNFPAMGCHMHLRIPRHWPWGVSIVLIQHQCLLRAKIRAFPAFDALILQNGRRFETLLHQRAKRTYLCANAAALAMEHVKCLSFAVHNRDRTVGADGETKQALFAVFLPPNRLFYPPVSGIKEFRISFTVNEPALGKRTPPGLFVDRLHLIGFSFLHTRLRSQAPRRSTLPEARSYCPLPLPVLRQIYPGTRLPSRQRIPSRR